MPSGNTAIHKAADKGHEGVVRALIEAGVDFDCKDAEGQTALDLAKGGGQAGVEALLVEAGGRRGKMEAFVEEGLGFRLYVSEFRVWAPKASRRGVGGAGARGGSAADEGGAALSCCFRGSACGFVDQD